MFSLSRFVRVKSEVLDAYNLNFTQLFFYPADNVQWTFRVWFYGLVNLGKIKILDIAPTKVFFFLT